MTFITFSKKWIVFKSALKRFKWLGILYGVTMFLMLPLVIWMELAKQKSIQGPLWVNYVKSYSHNILFNPVEHLVNLAVPVIFGLIFFHYLQKDRESTFFHSLPIRRTFLYLQNLLAGLTLIWLPLLINGLLVYGVFNIFGITEINWNNPYNNPNPMEMFNGNTSTVIPVLKIMLYWFFINFLMTGFFYVFTIFIGMLTGNVLLQGALTLIGLVLPLGVYELLKFNLWKILYGFPRMNDDRVIQWLSPLVSYLDDSVYRVPFEALTWHLWYFVVAFILSAVSIFLYQKRHVESAGETLANTWIRWIFKYGVAFCAALTGGAYLSSFYENSTAVLYLGYFIGALLGFIIGDMIAYKSFHFYKRWKGAMFFGVVFLLLVTGAKIDILGYESYVPAQNNISEVYLSILNREGNYNYQVDRKEGLKDKENLKLIRQLHQKIIAMEKENKADEILTRKPQMTGMAGSAITAPEEPQVSLLSTDIIYTLADGRKVKRTYTIDIFKYREILYPIFNSPEAKKILYSGLFKMDQGKVDQINVVNPHLNKNIRIYKKEEIREALTALKKDAMNISYGLVFENQIPPLTSIEFMTKAKNDNLFSVYNLNIYPESKNFETFLTRHGYFNDLFIDSDDISRVIIKKVDSDKTIEITDKNKIKNLLSWSNLDDQKGFTMNLQAREKMYYAGFYGKVVKKDGSLLFVTFDGSAYIRQTISEMFKER